MMQRLAWALLVAALQGPAGADDGAGRGAHAAALPAAASPVADARPGAMAAPTGSPARAALTEGPAARASASGRIDRVDRVDRNAARAPAKSPNHRDHSAAKPADARPPGEDTRLGLCDGS